MTYTLGIDTGTTSISIAALSDSLELIESITVNHEAFIPGDFPESRVQNPQRILEIVKSSVDSIISKHGKPSAIGFTGQMHGILYVNKNGQAVSPLYTWQDPSSNIPVNGKSSLEILHANGLKCSSGYGIGTHFYLQRAGKIPDDAVKFSTISDYIAMKICGKNSPILSAEMAAGLGAFNVRERRFDFEALKSAGVDTGYLPEVSTKCEVIGRTESGVPVASSMGDNQASFKGSVADSENTLLLNVGTGSQVSFMTRKFSDIDGDIELRPYGDDYLLAGSALCGGRAYAMLESFYREIAGHECYDVMSKHAEAFIDAHGLGSAWNVDTRFDGTRSDPAITGSITGITSENFCPGALTVGIISGIISELHGMYEAMKKMTGRSASVMIGSGNGLRKNAVMQKIATEIFALPLKISDAREEAARGAAMCASEIVI